jgi:hypothetical protein
MFATGSISVSPPFECPIGGSTLSVLVANMKNEVLHQSVNVIMFSYEYVDANALVL